MFVGCLRGYRKDLLHTAPALAVRLGACLCGSRASASDTAASAFPSLRAPLFRLCTAARPFWCSKRPGIRDVRADWLPCEPLSPSRGVWRPGSSSDDTCCVRKRYAPRRAAASARSRTNSHKSQHMTTSHETLKNSGACLRHSPYVRIYMSIRISRFPIVHSCLGALLIFEIVAARVLRLGKYAAPYSQFAPCCAPTSPCRRAMLQPVWLVRLPGQRIQHGHDPFPLCTCAHPRCDRHTFRQFDDAYLHFDIGH